MHCTTATSVNLVHPGDLEAGDWCPIASLDIAQCGRQSCVIRIVGTYQPGPVAHITRDSDTGMWAHGKRRH